MNDQTAAPPIKTLQIRADLAIGLRCAADPDLAHIARIYNDSVIHSTISFDELERSDAEWRAWLHDYHGPQHPVWCVLLDGNVVGWCSLSPANPKSAYRFATTPAIYLDKPAQHKGLGRPLLNFLEEEAKRLGYHAVVSDICTENDAVLRMLAHMGWRRIGVLREVGFKFDRWLDVAIYQKILT